MTGEEWAAKLRDAMDGWMNAVQREARTLAQQEARAAALREAISLVEAMGDNTLADHYLSTRLRALLEGK